MSEKHVKPVEWWIETNDRYNRMVSTIISLATSALVLPIVLLRQILNIPPEKALKPFLTCAAYLSWGCLGSSVLFGLLYTWISIKWIKLAWGQEISISEKALEWLLDFIFVGMGLLFFVGIVAGAWFFITVRGN